VNHLEEQQLEEKMVMSLGAKALAFAVILLLNGYLIFQALLILCLVDGLSSLLYACIFKNLAHQNVSF